MQYTNEILNLYTSYTTLSIMINEIKLETSHEADVVLALSADHKFFFPTFTPFTIVSEENESSFYVYAELTSLFSAFDVLAKVRKYIAATSVSYIMLFKPDLFKLPWGKQVDLQYKATPPTGNGKISVEKRSNQIFIIVEYEGDREKNIVNAIVKKVKGLKNLDEIIRKERISRHI